MASVNDKLITLVPLWSGTVGSGGVANDTETTIPLASGSGLTEGSIYVVTIDRVDSAGTKTLTKREVVIGEVSGDSLINCLRGQEGTAQAHSAGAVVEVLFTAKQWNRLIEGVSAEHSVAGAHGLTAFSHLNLSEGQMINGKIVPSVTSNNLTVALKGMDGNDPSATNPVHVRIGSAIRSVTAALSLTLNAGTNWFNAGSAGLATKEIDYFVYLGWETDESAVRIGFSRLPYGTVYSDFSASSAAENAAKYDSVPDATDEITVIGRFAATLSAGAGYTWSVPTFTPTNLIQRPIYETRWLTYQPTYAGFASMTYTSVNTVRARYKIKMGDVFLEVRTSGTTGGSASTYISATLPVNANPTTSFMAAEINDGGSSAGFAQLATSVVAAFRYDGANWGLGTERNMRVNGTYSISG